jgi:hypothetical protein
LNTVKPSSPLARKLFIATRLFATLSTGTPSVATVPSITCGVGFDDQL